MTLGRIDFPAIHSGPFARNLVIRCVIEQMHQLNMVHDLIRYTVFGRSLFVGFGFIRKRILFS